MKRFQRISTLMLALMLLPALLSACTKTPPTPSESSEEVTEANPSDPSSPAGTSNGSVCLSPTYFHCLEDFETFMRTGSDDAADYSTEHPPHALQVGAHIYWQHLKGGFLDVAEVFGLAEDILASFKHVMLYESGITIEFHCGLRISYTYDQEQKDVTVPQVFGKELRNDLKISDLKATPLSKKQLAAYTTGNYTVAYDTQFYEKGTAPVLIQMDLLLAANGFNITCTLDAEQHLRYVNNVSGNEPVNIGEDTFEEPFEELLADPIFESILPLFSDGAERDSALSATIEAINSREEIG